LLGGVYQARDEHELAIGAFSESLRLSPSAREPLRGMVASMVKLDRADEAVAYLKNLQKENPDNLYAKTLLGQVLAGTGNPDEAQAIFESALAADDAWLPAYTALAGLQSGDVSSQIDTYRRGLEAVPDSQELVLLLGTAYERSGQVEEAIASYERALEVNPDSTAVANNLAALLADNRTDTKSLERALELASQFSDSDNPAFLDTLGWVHYRLGNYLDAVPLMESAVKAAGQVAVLRYHLGMGYLALDKTVLAREQLELAVAGEGVSFTGIDEARAALAEL
jgi:tetratricopeptide (TPR) repeat protein